MVRFLSCVVILLTAAALLAVPALAQAQQNEPDRETPVESARAVLSDRSYQSDLPLPPEPREPSSASEPPRDASAPSSDPAPAAKTRRRAEPDSETSDARASDGTWLWVAAGVVGVPLIAYIFLTLYRARQTANAAKSSGGRKPKPHRPAPTRPPPRAPTPINEPTILDAADRLAGAGRYGEAIHILLLNGLEHAGRRARQRIPPALTNRELLRALPLAENMARALSVLVRISERSHFGDAAPSAADYQLSRENFQLFALESGAAS